MKKFLLSLCSLIGLFSSCSSSKDTLSQNSNNVDEIYGQASFSASSEKSSSFKPVEFEFELKSNPTTGFSWRWMNENEAAAELVEHKYSGDLNPFKMKGVGGKEIWKFKTKETGSDSLVFHYMRGAKSDFPPSSVYVYKIPK